MLTFLVLSSSANQGEVNLATNELKCKRSPLRQLNKFIKKKLKLKLGLADVCSWQKGVGGVE